MPNTVYVVLRQGIYIQQIAGVFSSGVKAQAAADTLQASEPDEHHGFRVLPFQLDAVAARLPEEFADTPLHQPQDVYGTGRCKPD